MPLRETGRTSLRALVIILLLLAANALLAGAKFPETAPARLMSQWLRYYNASDSDGLAAFVRDHYAPTVLRGRAPEELAGNAMRGRQNWGELTLHAVEKSEPEDFVAILKGNDVLPRWVRFNYQTAPGQPNRVATSEFRLVSAPADATQPKMNLSELRSDLETRLGRLVQEDRFSGAVLIAKDGEPVWQKSYGLEDREKNLPVDLETRFRLGSMNKMFTGVAVAQLVEKGKLKFSDTLSAVLPEYPNKEIARRVTVEQLLTHTSGLGDIFTPKFQTEKDNLHEIRDYVALFVDQPLKFEPGKSWSYSNAGYILLGLIIERLSGQSYYDYVDQNIFAPAGMTQTSSVPKTERPENIAIGYMRVDNELKTNWETMPYRGMSAGGGESTVGDLIRFSHALNSGKLLRPALVAEVTAGKAEPQKGAPARYGYGFGIRDVAGKRAVGHGGGAPGMNGQLYMLDDGYAVAVLANRDPSVAEDVADYIAARL